MRRLAISSLLALTLSASMLATPMLATPMLAAAQDARATTFVQTKHRAVDAILRAKKTDDDKLSKALAGLLSYEAISKEALGREWDKRSQQERAAFTSRLRQLIEANYRKNMRTTREYKIDYGGESAKDGRIRVPTTAKSKKNRRAPAVEVVYWLEPFGDSFSVVDVETDGVSLVGSYRRQFRKILRKDGWDGLLGRMDERLKSN